MLVYANRSADSVIFADELERLRSGAPARLAVHHHLDAERGFLDPAQSAAFATKHTGADFYICGPVPYMDTVEAGLSTLGVEPNQVFIERFVVPEDAPVATEGCIPESLVIRLERRKHTIAYHAGDTVLEAARRGGLRPPFSCEAGNCATCMAHLDEAPSRCARTTRCRRAISTMAGC